MLKDVVEADVRQFIEGDEELFFNERDFQMHLAVYLRSLGKYDDVDIEYYVPQKELDRYLWENELRLDIVVSKNGEYVPIELKYKTKAVSRPMTRFGERLSEKIPVMKNQGAQDLGRYDFWKDVRRVEMVRNRFHNVKGGLAVFMTNDRVYLNETKPTSNNCRFSMSEGPHPKRKHWLDANKSTAKGRPDFDVEKEYAVKWNAKEVGGVELNYCIVKV